MSAFCVLLALAASPKFADLPVKVASLGACTAGEYVYVYGGHGGKRHSYDTTTASSRFFRAKLTGGKWEELPAGPPSQGLGLVAHGNDVIRLGGMQPRNKPGTKADLHSLKGVARYDLNAKKWVALPDMPSARSSFDAVVLGDNLYVVGGWSIGGNNTPRKWHTTSLVLNLSAREPKWQEIKQPFKRRALGAAVAGGKLYVVGGLGMGKTSSEVEVYDTKTGKWSKGPDLPGTSRHGFSPAVCGMGGRVYVSTSDGTLHRLKTDGKGWEVAGKTSSRLVHRLVPGEKGELLLIGGGKTEVETVMPKG